MATSFSRDMHLIMLNQCIGSRIGEGRAESSLWWILARGVDLLNGVVPPLPSLSAYYFHLLFINPSFILNYQYIIYFLKKKLLRLAAHGLIGVGDLIVYGSL